MRAIEFAVPLVGIGSASDHQYQAAIQENRLMAGMDLWGHHT